MTANADHTHDRDDDPECVCGEIVHCPEQHVCLPIGWTTAASLLDPVLVTDDELDAYIRASRHDPFTVDDTRYCDQTPHVTWCCDWHRAEHERKPA